MVCVPEVVIGFGEAVSQDGIDHVMLPIPVPVPVNTQFVLEHDTPGPVKVNEPATVLIEATPDAAEKDVHVPLAHCVMLPSCDSTHWPLVGHDPVGATAGPKSVAL